MKKSFLNLLARAKNQQIRKVVANTFWLFAGRIVQMVVGLFVGVWVSRYLGVERFGLLSYSLAFVSLFSPFSKLGLSSLIVRNLTLQPEEKEQILGSAFWLQLLGAIAAIALMIACIFIIRRADYQTIGLVAILSLANVFRPFDVISVWFQSQVQSKYEVSAKKAAFLMVALAKTVLVSTGAPLFAFAVAYTAETAIGAFALMAAYRFKGHTIRMWQWSRPLAKKLIREGLPLTFTGLAVIVYMKIDQIMLGELSNDKAVGLYSSALRLSEVWYFIANAIATSLAPKIYEAKKVDDEALYYRRIELLLRLLAAIAIVIAVPMTFLSGRIILLLFGSDYAAAGPILSIHIWAALFVFMGVGASSWFIAEELANLNLRRTLIGAGVNIALNVFLIPRYGGQGAAIATVVSYAIASFLLNAADPRTFPIFRLQLRALTFRTSTFR